MIFLFFSCQYLNSSPCSDPIDPDSNLTAIFRHLEENQCLHDDDIALLEKNLDEYHKKTTVHCDQVFRRPSMDGKKFDGREELVLKNASVADVWIEKDGRHVIVYNDVTPKLLVEKAQVDPRNFWHMGLVGFGGLGLAVDHMSGRPIEKLATNLHLKAPLELVDPDIARTKEGFWRISFFAVAPSQMNDQQFGPMSAAKPHLFYRTESPTLRDFPTPEVILASSQGSNGGSDPAILERDDGSEILYIGPLDHTTMAWISEDGETWKTEAPPDFNTRLRFATPDAVQAPDGTYRLYGMTNGKPGQFEMAESKDGIKFSKPEIVFAENEAFNISVGVDPVGTWWAYYNKTDQKCIDAWGSQKIR